MLHPFTRALLVAAVAGAGAFALAFYRRQRRGASGGPISLPKVAWLSYAVFTWFLLSPLVAADPNVPAPYRWTFGLFAAFMWARGAAEMYMLYVTRSWRPPYGITHDALCVVLLAAALAAHRGELITSVADVPYLVFAGVLVAGLLVEILYAFLFFRAVQGRTTGHDGVWFADERDPRFVLINRITLTFNVPMYAVTGAFVALCLGLVRW